MIIDEHKALLNFWVFLIIANIWIVSGNITFAIFFLIMSLIFLVVGVTGTHHE